MLFFTNITYVRVPHYSKEETTINGYTIPAGTSIMANLDAVLFSSDTWTDPMQFRPERFLDANGDLTQPEQFVPFSIGRSMKMPH